MVVLLVVLAAVFGDYTLSLLASLLNYRALGQPMPLEFEGTYDVKAYDKSQEYTRARTVFSLANSTADLALLMIWWFVNISNFPIIMLAYNFENNLFL